MVIVKKVDSDARAEALSRFMAVGSDNLVGMADHPIQGRNLKKRLSRRRSPMRSRWEKSQKTGLCGGGDPISAILKAAEGRLLFEGNVTGDTNWEIMDGFTLGNIFLQGSGDYKTRSEEFGIRMKI